MFTVTSAGLLEEMLSELQNIVDGCSWVTEAETKPALLSSRNVVLSEECGPVKAGHYPGCIKAVTGGLRPFEPPPV